MRERSYRRQTFGLEMSQLAWWAVASASYLCGTTFDFGVILFSPNSHLPKLKLLLWERRPKLDHCIPKLVFLSELVSNLSRKLKTKKVLLKMFVNPERIDHSCCWFRSPEKGDNYFFKVAKFSFMQFANTTAASDINFSSFTRHSYCIELIHIYIALQSHEVNFKDLICDWKRKSFGKFFFPHWFSGNKKALSFLLLRPIETFVFLNHAILINAISQHSDFLLRGANKVQ